MSVLLNGSGNGSSQSVRGLPVGLGFPADEHSVLSVLTERVNILLVDDQRENLIALEAMLEPLEQNLILAGSAREALRVLLRTEVAAILLDVKMPDMDGPETAALIRERESTRHTPIIFLTAAEASESDLLRGYAAGAVDYLIKPVVPELVRCKVSVFVELAKKTEQLRRQATMLRESERDARELAERQGALLADLEQKNRELESFSYTVSHDLRTPLRSIQSFAQLLAMRYREVLDDNGREFLDLVVDSSRQMAQRIDDILMLSKVTRAGMNVGSVDLSAFARAIFTELAASDPSREVECVVAPGAVVHGDDRLLRIVLENLLQNAWKFTAERKSARIEFGFDDLGKGRRFFIRDDGAGFDMAHAGRLFLPFERLHDETSFPGSGVGLATVHRIINRHRGEIWAEAAAGNGATFFFTL
ncbi:MAG: response regulator [Gemmatimonadota bacterium]